MPMNPTSLTAVIFTINNLAALVALIICAVLSLFIYFLFYKRRKHRGWVMFFAIFLTLILGMHLTEKIFQKKPLSVEIVQAG